MVPGRKVRYKTLTPTPSARPPPQATQTLTKPHKTSQNLTYDHAFSVVRSGPEPALPLAFDEHLKHLGRRRRQAVTRTIRVATRVGRGRGGRRRGAGLRRGRQRLAELLHLRQGDPGLWFRWINPTAMLQVVVDTIRETIRVNVRDHNHGVLLVCRPSGGGGVGAAGGSFTTNVNKSPK